MIKNFTELLELAKSSGKKKVSVAVAQDHDVLSAIKIAMDEDIVTPILVGDKIKIEEIAKEIKMNIEGVQIINELDNSQAARIATELVSSGIVDILMKGLVDTSIIMKQVLDKEIGLRTHSILSHVAMFQVDTFHKVFMVTDAAMNIAPDLNEKKQILENCIKLYSCLDDSNAKVAVIAAKEKVSEKMEATIHGKILEEMNKEDKIKDCIIEGPLALDNAISKESATLKGIEGKVVGDADILLMPNIETGNVLYKSLTFLANAKSAGLILGAKAPIVLTSRADNVETKLNSLALGVLMASK